VNLDRRKQTDRATGPKVELLWASPREVFNLMQADDIGCDIITMTPDLIKKADSFGKNLEQFSLEIV
jgi:transaldolase